MKFVLVALLLVFYLGVGKSFSQCAGPVKAFQGGERLVYAAYYNLGLIWVEAGAAELSVTEKNYIGRNTYFFETYGYSLPKYDWIMKVRTRFQAYSDKQTSQVLWAHRNSTEGSDFSRESYLFHSGGSKISYTIESNKIPFRRDSMRVSGCVFDVLSATYYCRTLNFDKYQPSDKIPVNVVLSGKQYSMYIRILGRETIVNRENQKSYRCIKFTASMIEGTIFSTGESIIVWVTDDENRLPILVQAKILVGSVKAYLRSAQGQRNETKAVLP